MKYYSPFKKKDLEDFPHNLYLPHSHPEWLKHKKSDKEADDISANTIVICLHGFTATTYEALPVAKSVFNSGMDAATLLFPAHGLKNIRKAKEMMGKVKYTEYLNAVRSDISIARKKYENVFIYGQSMGGAVSIIMAEEGLVDVCATTAPAISIPRKAELISFFLGWMNFNKKKDIDEDKPYFNEEYPFFNAKSIRQLSKLAKLARRNLEKIDIPFLECHSKLDLDINPNITQWFKKRNSGPVEIRWFNKSGHSMPLDIQRDEIIKTITDFFLQQKKIKYKNADS